jgi:hypothetical protein
MASISHVSFSKLPIYVTCMTSIFLFANYVQSTSNVVISSGQNGTYLPW